MQIENWKLRRKIQNISSRGYAKIIKQGKSLERNTKMQQGFIDSVQQKSVSTANTATLILFTCIFLTPTNLTTAQPDKHISPISTKPFESHLYFPLYVYQNIYFVE